MTMMTTMTIRTAVTALLLLACGPLAAQQPASRPGQVVTRAAGPQYEASGLQEALGGENWRSLWIRPLTIPVLDLGMNGGLKPERQGGGNQSITLHFEDARGTGWVFRSVDKHPEQALPPDLAGTVVQDIIEDQVTALHPGGHFIVPRLLEALDILHVTPTLYVMPDDPRLGEFRETFAHMIGMLELKPNEGADDTPGFGGSTKIKDSDAFLEDLEESPAYRLDDREYLRARLVDLLVNDTDRGTDQWRWARYGEKGDQVYRPLPRDRDWTLVNAEGFVSRLARGVFPKHTFFDDDYPSLAAFTFSSHVLDRRLLTALTRDDFRREVAAVQRRLTDAVLAAAVRDMPEPYHADHAEEVTEDLRERRDDLWDIVEPWYAWLAREPDVRGTDEADRATVEHLPDGSLRVSIGLLDGSRTYYQRTFLPAETDEVRLYLHGGDDHAVVSGDRGPIKVRVIGGGGDDTLEDRAGGARFYDERGDNQFIRGGGTKVSTEEWSPPPPPEGIRLGRAWRPDFGRSRSFGPVVDYREGAGVIVGARRSYTRQGFRRVPYRHQLGFSGLYATRSGGFGGTFDYDYRFENSRRALVLNARGSEFEAFRFYGWGNDTPELDADEALVMQDQARVYAGMTWHFGPHPGRYVEPDSTEEDPVRSTRPFLQDAAGVLTGTLTVGPVAQWTRPRPPADNPLAGAFAGEDDSFGQVGARVALDIARTDRASAPRRGFAIEAEAEGFPAVWDAAETFGTVSGTARGYLPLLGATHLAVRLGGAHVLGDAPAFESAFLGGRTSLRGYRFQRFAGDAAAFGSAELRIPIDTVKLVLNGELGVYGLADAGRVWVDGDSPGGWHDAFGGGVWFSTMGRAISLTYARGERSRWYLWAGLPF